MDAATIHQRLGASFGSGVGACVADVNDPYIMIEPGVICDVGRVLHDDPEMFFDSLSNLTGVDYKDAGHLQVVYHLYSYKHRHNIVLKVNAPRDEPIVPSVESVWKAANWLEREVYDLVGVQFTNHPDLRRLLMPEDWVGHPLRKDFVEPEEYHGINTRRESLLR